jgi:hypothetical protein
VELLVLRPDYYIGNDSSHLILACFGAQAVLCGVVILSSRFTANTFLIFGLIGSIPFMIFNYYFYFVKEMFSAWMLLDFVGFCWKYWHSSFWFMGVFLKQKRRK